MQEAYPLLVLFLQLALLTLILHELHLLFFLTHCQLSLPIRQHRLLRHHGRRVQGCIWLNRLSALLIRIRTLTLLEVQISRAQLQPIECRTILI